MTRPLTDTQRVILAHAATLDSRRIFPIPTTLNKNSRAITLSVRPLVALGMIAEIPADKLDIVWAETAEGVSPKLLTSTKSRLSR